MLAGRPAQRKILILGYIPNLVLNMTKNEVIKKINQLSFEERLAIIELLVHQLREEMKKTANNKNTSLAVGAQALIDDYNNDKELTIFTQIDSEDFHATN